MAGNRALTGATQPRDIREVTDPGSSRTAHPRAGSRCRIRVIDTFGTEPAYNHEEYATLHGYRTNWGYWNLNPKQFMTMFRESRGSEADGVSSRFSGSPSSLGGGGVSWLSFPGWPRLLPTPGKPGLPFGECVSQRGSLLGCLGSSWRGGASSLA